MDYLWNVLDALQYVFWLIAIVLIWRVFKSQTQKRLLIVDKQNQNELVMNKSILLAIGLVAGVIGAALGLLPFLGLHEFLAGLLPKDASRFLFILAFGYPIHIGVAIFVLPIGGALMGMIGENIGVKRYLKKNIGNDHLWRVSFWWGLVFGFFINLFFGVFSY